MSNENDTQPLEIPSNSDKLVINANDLAGVRDRIPFIIVTPNVQQEGITHLIK